MALGKKVVLTLFCFLFLFSFVSAVSPFQQTSEGIGIAIEVPVIETHKYNEDFKFHIHAFNSSDGISLTNESIDCIIHLYSPLDGSHLIEDTMSFDSNGIDFEYEVLGSNFSEVGEYAVLFNCVDTTLGGFFEYSFEVTRTGYILTEPQASIYLAMIFVLFCLFLLLVFGYYKMPSDVRDDDGYVLDVSKLAYLKPVLLGLAWILLTSIMFIVSNISLAYMSTQLIGEFLFGIYVLMLSFNLLIIPLCIIKMIQRITLSKDMLGLIERGVEFK